MKSTHLDLVGHIAQRASRRTYAQHVQTYIQEHHTSCETSLHRRSQAVNIVAQWQSVERGPKESWGSVVQSDTAELNMTNSWFTLVADRLAWGQLIDSVHTYLGPSPD